MADRDYRRDEERYRDRGRDENVNRGYGNQGSQEYGAQERGGRDGARGGSGGSEERRWGGGQPGGNYSGSSYGSTGAWTQGPYSGRGPQGYQRSNDRIREDVCDVLTRHGEIDAVAVEVIVESGEVTLDGTVGSRREKRMA